MNLIESDMSLPVMRWLDGLGYTPYAESQNYDTCIDIVAMKGPEPKLIAIEMKVGLTQHVIRQAYIAQLVAEQSYCAVLSRPRPSSLAKCADLGIGVLRVEDGVVRELLRPRPKKSISPGAKDFMVQQLQRRPPGGVAGKPILKGEGPAQKCARRVLSWRKRNPGATWRDVYSAVDNHYVSMESMRGALRGLV